jgi:hypothetical protein
MLICCLAVGAAVAVAGGFAATARRPSPGPLPSKRENKEGEHLDPAKEHKIAPSFPRKRESRVV